MTKKNFIKFVGIISVLCVIFAGLALSAEAETEKGKETVTTTEISTTESATTEISASSDDVTQEKQENQVMKYLVPAAVVILAAVGIFLVKKYKR